MRRYLLFSATLYLIVGCLLLNQDFGKSTAIVSLQLFDEWFRWFVTILCFIVSGVKFTAAILRRRNWQIIAVSVGVGLAACLVIETLASALFAGSSLIAPVLWLYICISTYSVMPFAVFDERDDALMEQIRGMLDAYRRTADHESKQIKRRIEEKHP